MRLSLCCDIRLFDNLSEWRRWKCPDPRVPSGMPALAPLIRTTPRVPTRPHVCLPVRLVARSPGHSLARHAPPAIRTNIRANLPLLARAGTRIPRTTRPRHGPTPPRSYRAHAYVHPPARPLYQCPLARPLYQCPLARPEMEHCSCIQENKMVNGRERGEGVGGEGGAQRYCRSIAVVCGVLGP